MNRILRSVVAVWAGMWLFDGVPAHGQAIPDSIPKHQTEDLGNGLYTFRTEAYRSIFLVSDKGVIVTDPISTEHAAAFRQAIAEITDQPVKYVAYSHSHWDHASGGQIFKDEGAKFVAQEHCLINLDMSPNPEIVPADITFEDRHKIRLGDVSLEMFYFGPSHDTCMVVMLARPANILFVVDVLTPPTGYYVPFDDILPDFHLYNAVSFFSQIEDLVAREGIETLVGGHLLLGTDETGKVVARPSTGPAVAVTERRIFWEMAIGEVRKALDTGASPLFVHEQMDTSAFKDMRGYSDARMKRVFRRISSYFVTGR